MTACLHLTPTTGPLSLKTARTWAVLAVAAACSPGWAALAPFTLDPAAASPALAGTAVVADNLVLSNRSHVTIDAGTGAFLQSGVLSLQTLQYEGVIQTSPGLNVNYGLYMTYEAAGTSTPGDLLTQNLTGSFTSFDYTLYGFNGSAATFGFDAANNPTVNAVGAFALGTGSLKQGSLNTSPASGANDEPSFVPSSNVKLTFAATAAGDGYFASPEPFYNTAFLSFTNTVSQVEAITPFEYRIRQGGGAMNFATSAVPEPETYAPMIAGLGILGFLGRRRGLTGGQ